MSESTLKALTGYVDNARETIREYARQIESGEYGNRWELADPDTGAVIWSGMASSEDDATGQYFAGQQLRPLADDWKATRIEFDEPTICDEYGNAESIYDYPLSVEVKIGRPLAVVIGTGGPHIEIVHDLSVGSAKLAGYWGGEKVYRHGPEFQTVLDYLTAPLWDEIPDEYK